MLREREVGRFLFSAQRPYGVAMEPQYLTIPCLARLLEVTPPTVRYWIRAGWIKAPERLGPSGVLAYSRLDAVAIRQWYLKRSAAGLSRGIGATEKQRRALSILAERR